MRSVHLLLLSFAFFHTGCAAFGIATRNDLDEQSRAASARYDQMREENRILRDRFAQLTGTLEATEKMLAELEQELESAQARSNERSQEIWSQTGDLQVRMAALEDRLTSASTVSDSLRNGIVTARRAAQAASTEALTVRQDLDAVADRADLARSRSETLLRAWLTQLREERGRLERQLSALEASLAQWESEVFETSEQLSGPVDSAERPVPRATDGRDAIE